jgi:hypothetical protein
MFRSLVLTASLFTFAFAGLAPVATAQPRPTAPVGYLVAVAPRDGSKFPDGSAYRLYGVTRDFKTRSEWVNTINSYHVLKALVVEIKTENEYKAAIQMIKDQPKMGAPAQKPVAPPAAASVAGTRWEWGGETMYFYADGTYERAEFTKGAVSNLRGKWTQTGNKLTLSNDGTYTINGDTMSNALVMRRKIK